MLGLRGLVLWISRVLSAVAHATTAFGHYTSTYCLHGDHVGCRRTCKVCGSSCRCSCHPWNRRAKIIQFPGGTDAPTWCGPGGAS